MCICTVTYLELYLNACIYNYICVCVYKAVKTDMYTGTDIYIYIMYVDVHIYIHIYIHKHACSYKVCDIMQS